MGESLCPLKEDDFNENNLRPCSIYRLLLNGLRRNALNVQQIAQDLYAENL